MGQMIKIGSETRLLAIFLEFGSLVFLEISYNDSLKTCLTSSRNKTHKKKFGGLNLSQNRTRNYVFGHFLKFGSLVFLEIAYNDSLQTCLTSSRDKTYAKEKFGPKGPKLGSKLGFLSFS